MMRTVEMGRKNGRRGLVVHDGLCEQTAGPLQVGLWGTVDENRIRNFSFPQMISFPLLRQLVAASQL